MKSYYQNYDQLAAAWVAGKCAPDAHTAKRRMFCESNRIYSYGGHFKIAEKWTAPNTKREWFLLTERTFSSTTRTHVKSVTCAIPVEQRVYLPSVDNLGRDMTPPEYKRMNPNYSINLASSQATESDLGILNLHNEIDKLDEYASTFLRKLKPWTMDYVNEAFESAAQSVARFGLELPPRFKTLHEQCATHFNRRRARMVEAQQYEENPVQSLAA